jgi:hypothetical protein
MGADEGKKKSIIFLMVLLTGVSHWDKLISTRYKDYFMYLLVNQVFLLFCKTDFHVHRQS